MITADDDDRPVTLTLRPSTVALVLAAARQSCERATLAGETLETLVSPETVEAMQADLAVLDRALCEMDAALARVVRQ